MLTKNLDSASKYELHKFNSTISENKSPYFRDI